MRQNILPVGGWKGFAIMPEMPESLFLSKFILEGIAQAILPGAHRGGDFLFDDGYLGLGKIPWRGVYDIVHAG